jgi:hypothetical protein
MSRCHASLPRFIPPLVAAVALGIAVVAPATALAAVTVSRAEVSSGALRIDGRATANRSITVDGVAMASSDGSGAFRVSRSSYAAPADCTVDVNDGSATPAVARLTGCAVSSTPPSTLPLGLAPEGGIYVIPLEVGVFANRFWLGSGGTLPYRWSVAAGTLPPGMSLIQDDPDGTLARIGGTPTAAGSFTFTLRITDARGAAATREETMTIGDGTVLPGEPGTGLISLTLSPSTVTGGATSTATVVLGAPAPPGGGFTSLASDNRLLATVPASVTVPEGSTTATFPVSTAAVTSVTLVPISASYGGVTRTASLTINPSTSTAPDTVSITRAQYDSSKRTLRVEATSTRTGVTLRAYNTATGALIGTLSGGGGTFSATSNPQSVTVKSSAGGSATRTVTVK